jgi:SAM-dependent methyltransferase
MLRKLKSYLIHPLARDLNVDASATVCIRERIIREKPFLRKMYHEWYQSIIDSLPGDNTGSILELGSGGGFLKDYIPGLVTSEILQIDDVDIILDAQCLPFKKATLQGIVMVDVFHHIPCVRSFIADAAFCVKPGGFMIMIEPWNTQWSQLVYRHLHPEPFHPTVKNWEFSKGGPLSQANSALPRTGISTMVDPRKDTAYPVLLFDLRRGFYAQFCAGKAVWHMPTNRSFIEPMDA